MATETLPGAVYRRPDCQPANCQPACWRHEALRLPPGVTMEEPRKSLWSRLVVFYSENKRDQLNPKVRCAPAKLATTRMYVAAPHHRDDDVAFAEAATILQET